MDLASFDFITLREGTAIPSFRCKDPDLNGFLFDDAKKYLSELMATTYLFVDPKANKTVAYFSLLNDKIASDPEERALWNRINRNISNPKRRKTYPSVKIGRLAISEEYERRGIGSKILHFINMAFTNGNRTGCRFVTVDAYANVTDFYLKNGFHFLTKKDAKDATRLMCFDLKPFKDGNPERVPVLRSA